MRYILDTTVLIDHALDKYGASELIERLLGETGDIYVCDVVVAEALAKGSDDEIRIIDRLVEALEYVATTPSAARWAGASRRRLGRNSHRRLADSIVAGVAWDFDATVVTRNARDFEGQGIPVLSYGQPATP
jgi:predicted nucleic acid-binding protein